MFRDLTTASSGLKLHHSYLKYNKNKINIQSTTCGKGGGVEDGRGIIRKPLKGMTHPLCIFVCLILDGIFSIVKPLRS